MELPGFDKLLKKPVFKSFTEQNFRANLGLLTREVPEGAESHHIFAQKFEKDFKTSGINIHDPKYGSWWDKVDHAKNAHDYNKAWEDFFAGGTKNRDDILQKGRELAKKYGLEINF